MQHSQPPTHNEIASSDDEEPREHGAEAEGAAFRRRFFDADEESRLRAALASSLPIDLEVGSGKGLFLTRAAQQHPQRLFIGLELATKYAKQAQSRLEKLRIDNACFVACDAVAVLQHDVADASLHAAHVYFPDPWWKSRHKKRRVLSDETILNVQRALVPGGQLHFWTDVLDYYEEAVARIGALTSLAGPFYVPEPSASHDMDYRTHFERRTRLNGLPVYRARFEKLA